MKRTVMYFSPAPTDKTFTVLQMELFCQPFWIPPKFFRLALALSTSLPLYLPPLPVPLPVALRECLTLRLVLSGDIDRVGQFVPCSVQMRPGSQAGLSERLVRQAAGVFFVLEDIRLVVRPENLNTPRSKCPVRILLILVCQAVLDPPPLHPN